LICCKQFREQVKDQFNIEYIDYKKKWVFNTDWDRDNQCEIEIDYCPFCGAKLRADDL